MMYTLVLQLLAMVVMSCFVVNKHINLQKKGRTNIKCKIFIRTIYENEEMYIKSICLSTIFLWHHWLFSGKTASTLRSRGEVTGVGGGGSSVNQHLWYDPCKVRWCTWFRQQDSLGVKTPVKDISVDGFWWWDRGNHPEYKQFVEWCVIPFFVHVWQILLMVEMKPIWLWR